VVVVFIRVFFRFVFFFFFFFHKNLLIFFSTPNINKLIIVLYF